MNRDWLLLIKKYDVESARIRFEEICERLFKRLHPGKRVATVAVKQGDGGIDVFVGEIGVAPIDVIQCKFFINGIEESQKSQIRASFKRAVESKDFETKSWTLCVINQLTLEQNIWWSNWKKSVMGKYGLSDDFIQLKDGNELSDLLKAHGLYNDSFELDESIMISEIHHVVVKENATPELDTREIIRKASSPLLSVRNFIENRTGSHIAREETQTVYDWIFSPLKDKQRNVLVLKGDKGLGKSAILKDLYGKLLDGDCRVLAIKADKFYASTLHELEFKLFSGQLTFDTILKQTQGNEGKLVVIIDQIDALSLTLSSNREYIETYNNLIGQLQHYDNVRIVISVRDYDLKFDAELSVYNADLYKKVNVGRLIEKEVRNVLSLFNIQCPSEKVLELLKNPNNLDIYCKIYEGGSKRIQDSISSLKDLYDQLWKKYISAERDLNLKELIFTIAGRMYSEQRISIGNVYEDEFYLEMHYLNSNSLLSEFNGEIQFFHQSFYEYCFARQFVENGENLERYILINGQSLYVRAVIKMVLEYQREYDMKGYAATIENILSGADFRFHIKSLILNILGAVYSPTVAEKKLSISLIFDNIDFEDIFMCSVLSRDWTEFIIGQDIPHKYLNPQKKLHETEEKYAVIKQKMSHFSWAFFINNIAECPLLILEFLDAVDFEGKQDYIARLLLQIEDWSDRDLLWYFEKYVPYNTQSKFKRSNYGFYELLKKIFRKDSEYAFDRIAPAISEIYNADPHRDEFEYTLNETVKYFYKELPDATFEFLFELYRQVSEKASRPYFEHNKFPTPLHLNINLDDREIFSRNDIKNIKNYLYDYLGKCTDQKITRFFESYKNSNNVNMLSLVLKSLKPRYYDYKSYIVELLQILKTKNAFSGADDNFQLEIRNLISEVYVHLETPQQLFVNNLVLNINSKYDYHFYPYHEGRRANLRSFGKKKYQFIKALPLAEIKKHRTLYSKYLELNRKFGEQDEKKALHVSSSEWGTVGPPLKDSAYDNMDLKGWKNSMVKYNESFRPTAWLKGDIFDHSNVFSRKVMEKPDRFYDFLDSLFSEKEVSLIYILSGIGGLVDAKYDPEKVKKLFKRYLGSRMDNSTYQRTHLNHYAGYLLRSKAVDAVIVQFLADTVLHFQEETVEEDSGAKLDNAVNTVKGSALYQLMHCYEHKEFEELVFSTVEKAGKGEKSSDKLKAVILHNLAYLNHLNIDRAFAIFNALTETDNVDVLESSLHTSQYFIIGYYDQMSRYFDKIISLPTLHKQAHVIASGWLKGYDKRKDVYNRFINTGKDARLCAIDTAEEFLINEDGSVDFKALDILLEFLSEIDPEFASEYSGIILRKFKPMNFLHFETFLQHYAKSVLCKIEPSYYLQYLLSCVKDHPKSCLVQLCSMDFSIVPSIQERGYYDKEPVQLVLGIYSKLVSQVKKDKILIGMALDVFDSMLKNSLLRHNANNSMDTLL